MGSITGPSLLCRKRNHCAVCAQPFAPGAIKYLGQRIGRRWRSPIGNCPRVQIDTVPLCESCLNQSEREMLEQPVWAEYRWYDSAEPCPGCGHPMRLGFPSSRRGRTRRVCSVACALKLYRAKRRVTTAICPVCTEAFEPRRKDSLYCSSACRQLAYRQRLSRRAA
jgi:predicted nucleic acid-binding Zn ribbon protein